ncbi:MAG: GlxA family transcriptional regulator [Streptomyces sp.]|uniref:GlxA family transcriptional regulator n=1 Tax=Streptomyces sp. TaxID=1931 RepID=UPI003D6C214C
MKTRRVVVVGYDGAQVLDIACVTSTFAGANRIVGRRLYDVELVTPAGRAITCDAGLVLRPAGSLQRATGTMDTLVVSGGDGHEDAAANPALVAHVRRLAGTSTRVASVCTGATVLAATGLLDGRRATTHWAYAARLARHYPAVTVDPDPIYIREGNIATSAGVTSALDLTLSFIAEDHGDSLARAVARSMVTYLHRPGNQAQVSMFVAHTAPAHQLVRDVVEFVTTHVDEPLDSATLAHRFSVSERQLSRLFQAHAGMSPGRFVRRTRTEAAARLLSVSTLTVALIAQRCGFGTAEALRQAFVRHYGISPSRYRLAHATSVAS